MLIRPDWPRSSARIFSLSRTYSVRPTIVGTVHAARLNNWVRAWMTSSSGVALARYRTPFSSRMISFPSASTQLALAIPRSRQPISPVRVLTAAMNADPIVPLEP